MINVRQIETTSVTFNQYNNGINEIIYHECSERAANNFVYFVGMVAKATPSHDTAYIVCNLGKVRHQFLDYHYAQIKKLDALYPSCKRPYFRFANISPEMTKEQEMILGYMQSLDIPRMKFNMFAIDDYQKAISWLLGGT